MPGLRDIKNRIKGIKNIQQITKAMQMVAAAKIKKAQDKVLNSRPYAEKINSIFHHVAEHIDGEGIREPLLDVRPVKNVGLILVTSDKGLCGSYNTNIMKHYIRRLYEFSERSIETKSWLLGNKSINFFKVHGGIEILGWRNGMPTIPTYTDAMEIVAPMTKAYKEKKLDKIILFYTKFVSMLKYEITELELLPIVPGPKSHTLEASYLFEPTAQDVIEKLLPVYLETLMYQALLESSASELAARMTAMNTATKNASDLLENITLIYNKARQASITREILEVVSAADALK